jgi:uncharacterized protein RhaS with RHS repeats
MTPDPAGMIDGPNLYTYARNNPVRFVDPWGLCADEGEGEIADLLDKIKHAREIQDEKAYRELFRELQKLLAPSPIKKAGSLITDAVLGALNEYLGVTKTGLDALDALVIYDTDASIVDNVKKSARDGYNYTSDVIDYYNNNPRQFEDDVMGR